MPWNFVVIDVDAGVALADRQKYAAAQQRQLREHFAPLWDGLGISACVRAATPEAPSKLGEIEIRLLKNAPASQAGALAYHDAKPDGTPICYVFVQLCQQYGDTWTSAASHEVLETMSDPRLRLCVELDDGSIWDREVCDRVEALTVNIDGVALSNFNTPAAFEPPTTLRGVKFDFLNKSTSPNQILPGGYAQKFDPSRGWVMKGQMRSYRAHLKRLELSRGARRVVRNLARNPDSLMKRSLWGRFMSWLRCD